MIFLICQYYNTKVFLYKCYEKIYKNKKQITGFNFFKNTFYKSYATDEELFFVRKSLDISNIFKINQKLKTLTKTLLSKDRRILYKIYNKNFKDKNKIFTYF